MRAGFSLGIGALLLWGGSAGLAQTAALQSQVAQAVARDLGFSRPAGSAPGVIQILASEVRVPEQASLRVAAVHAAAAGDTWLLRMECGSRRQCLPFEVVLRGQPNLPAAARLSRAPAVVAPRSRIAAPLVRAGQRVQVAENVSAVHLSTPAVCLQSGSLGQRIQVRNLSSRRVVLARVRAAGQLVVED